MTLIIGTVALVEVFIGSGLNCGLMLSVSTLLSGAGVKSLLIVIVSAGATGPTRLSNPDV